MKHAIKVTEFQTRRKQLLAKCEPDSIVVIAASNLVTRSNDTEYHFRQNSYFWYLSGFNEASSLIVLSNKRNEHVEASCSHIFVQAKDKTAEIWHGRRLGVEQASSVLGFDFAHSAEELATLLPELIDGHSNLYYSMGENEKADEVVKSAIEKCKNAPKQQMTAPRCIIDVNVILDRMRQIKSDSEIEVMRKAAEISADAHNRAMAFCAPNKWEYQLEAEILHEFSMQGARFAAYNTIVGGGENACILHYTENNMQLNEGDLVLIDAGCEYQGYAADITRTFPVNGKFSKEQAQIYQLVLDAQKQSIEILRAGTTIAQAMDIAVNIITRGLIDLGIIRESLEDALSNLTWRNFFMHGLGHYLGLDVHDVGIYKDKGEDIALEAGMVLTVEPGIYIDADADVPKKYKGIGVRIEDNVLIKKDGVEILSARAPKEIHEIEALMAK